MEVSGQFHAPAAVLGEEAGSGGENKNSCTYRESNPGRAACKSILYTNWLLFSCHKINDN